MPKKDTPTLADKAQRIAEGAPRDAVRALIERFLPRTPVNTRPPVPEVAKDKFGVPNSASPSEKQPLAFAKLSRRSGRRMVTKRYTWVGWDSSREGTFRRYMLTEVIRAHTDTAAALKFHANSGRYADQTINFSWAEKNGYIKWEI